MEEKINKHNRNFDLGKPRERHFDLTKDSDGMSSSLPPGGNEEPHTQPSTNGWKKPLGIAALIALLGVGSYVYSLWSNRNPPPPIITGRTDEHPPVQQQTSDTDETIPDEDVQKPAPEEPAETLTDASKGTEAEEQPEQPMVPGQPASGGNIPAGTLEQKARQVIRGDFGNGQVRKDRLGAEYAEIQGKFNEMYRNCTWRY